MDSPARGRFITLEGGEGTGKSTLQTALRDRLAEQGVDVVLTREPGGTPRAEAVRPVAARPAESRVADHELDEAEADMPFYRKALAQRHADDPGGYGPNWSNIDDFDIPTVLRKQMD